MLPGPEDSDAGGGRGKRGSSRAMTLSRPVRRRAGAGGAALLILLVVPVVLILPILPILLAQWRCSILQTRADTMISCSVGPNRRFTRAPPSASSPPYAMPRSWPPNLLPFLALTRRQPLPSSLPPTLPAPASLQSAVLLQRRQARRQSMASPTGASVAAGPMALLLILGP